MNKTVLKEKESYETPEILDIKPVSVAGQGTGSPVEPTDNKNFDLSE